MPSKLGAPLRTRLSRSSLTCLAIALFVVSVGSSSSATSASVADEPPNIVVVITDDFPVLDGRLIDVMPIVRSVFKEQGVSFTDFHGESPQCCPGRAGYLSGQHTTNHGVDANKSGLFNPVMSIATQLRGVGYHTMLVGKYMNTYGACKNPHPLNCAPNVPPGWDRWIALSAPGYFNYDLWVDGSPTPVHHGSAPEDYSTDVFREHAVNLIAQTPADERIFAWIAPLSPHSPNQAAPRHKNASCPVSAWRPPNYKEADVSDKPAWVQAIPLKPRNENSLPSKCRLLLSADELVEEVRAALAATGRLENTLLIFAGDNGMSWYEHRLWGKGDPYQTQLPFFVSWPARLGDEPRTITERLQNIDLAPTLCEIAGCVMGPYPNGQATPDGLSFAGLLLGTATSVDRESIFENMPKGNKPAPRWFSVTSTNQSPLAFEGCAAATSGGCLWQYTTYPQTGEEELYDISNGPCWEWDVGQPGDPCKLQNVASDPSFAVIKLFLQQELQRLQAQRGTP